MSIYSLLKHKKSKLLFTTPSHDGKFFALHKFYNWYKADISEIELLNPQEALEVAEKNAAKIYKTKFTKFLTNGSTSGIIAAVLTCAKNKKILIWNNAHQCHKNAAIIANCDITEYLLKKDENLGIYKPITPDYAKSLIIQHKPDAIIITSPTYEGFVTDIKTISTICKENNVKLIADEAHGALYPFSDKLPESAVQFADYTIQSLHKTAGGINPTALLHSNDKNPGHALSLINTTSPSYPMLATIEANIKFLNSNKGKKKINELINQLTKLRETVKNVEFYGDDITKMLIKHKDMSGYELSEKLYKDFNIEDERTNDKTTLLLTGIGTSKNKIKKLQQSLNKF